MKVPEPFRPVFLRAQDYVSRYFKDRRERPEHGTISISGERYVLLRAASMSVEFFDLVTSLYRDKGPEEARRVASNLLFDIAHSIGKADAGVFQRRMGSTTRSRGSRPAPSISPSRAGRSWTSSPNRIRLPTRTTS